MWMSMPTEPHTFDSCGDLLLVLSKPSDPADTPKNTGNHEDIKDALIRNRSREQDATSNRDGGDGVPTHTYSEYSSSPEDDSGDTIKIPMLVSFRHMMLASPVFRAMLDGNFKEGRDLTSNGKVQVPLPDDDPAALAIILNIVHGHNRRVPRRVSLELLTNITILVDKYQMVEAVEFFAETWMEGLKKVIPTNYGSRTDVHRWISIAWVFNCQGNFKSMTQITTRYTGARLVDEVDGRLPIPAIILESIMAQRNQALSAAYTFIGDKVKAYQGTNLSCPSTAEFFKGFQKPNIKNYPSTESSRGSCDSMVLGSLLKNLAKLGLWPYPSAPYGHFTIEGLYHPVNRLELVSLCDQFKPPELEFRYLLPRADCHGLRNALSTEVTTLRESVSGLDIQDFRKDS